MKYGLARPAGGRRRFALALCSETIKVPPETMRGSVSSSFALPPAQQPRPSPSGARSKKR